MCQGGALGHDALEYCTGRRTEAPPTLRTAVDRFGRQPLTLVAQCCGPLYALPKTVAEVQVHLGVRQDGMRVARGVSPGAGGGWFLIGVPKARHNSLNQGFKA
jgi:hypothetical protein